MKFTVILSFLLFVSVVTFSQDYMDKIAAESCKCIEDMGEDAPEEGYVEQLGLCMITASQPYQKELKKDYDIDFEQIDKEGERLGRIIGLKMVGVCPKALIDVSKKVKDKKAGQAGAPVESYSGKIVKVESDVFLVVHVKDEAGKVNKFFWLEFVESNVEISEMSAKLVGKSVDLTFTSRELYDPKTKEYRKFSIVKKFEVD